MSSYDFLTKVINPARVEAGEKPVRNNDFVSRIEDELDGQNVAYEIFVSFGQDVKSYTLNTDQLLLVGLCVLWSRDLSLSPHTLGHAVEPSSLWSSQTTNPNYLKSFCLRPVACWSPFTWGLE